MADQTPGPPGHDPLGDRLRATFKAERDDIERRHAGNVPAPRRRLTLWAPLAVAATALALAGFFFLGNQPADQAVDLDVAAQPSEDGGAEESPSDGGDGDDVNGEVETDTGEGQATETAAAPTATATPAPGPPNVEPPGPPPDEEPPSAPPVPDTNRCGQDIAPGTPHFVTGIAVDDPDGGLVAHTQAGIEEPVTRILVLDEVVEATGGCTVMPSGSIWLQLAAPDGTADWASGRYLVPAKSACLVGEQVGTRIQGDEQLVHVVSEGDRMTTIADNYNVSVDELLRANPGIDGEIFIGDVLSIPFSSETLTLFGPVEGAAWFDFTQVAFAEDGAEFYRWYPQGAVRITDSCYGEGPTGPVCLVGALQLIDPQSPEPIYNGSGSIEATRTGRTLPGYGSSAVLDWVEVTITTEDGSSLTGFVDGTRTGFTASPCGDDPALLDTFDARPCAINDATPLESTGTVGTAESDADHVHNIRVEVSTECVRAVITLGTDVWGDSDRPAELLPEITSTKTATAATVRFAPCDRANESCPVFSSGEGEPQRVDFSSGSVFIGVDADFQPYVTMLHRFGQSSVTFINSPARIIIDWQRGDADSGSDPVIGQSVIFPGGLDSFKAGELIRGLARPFEAQGGWYVFEASGDPAAPVRDPARAVAQGFYMTSSWAEGWGEFTAQLPPLPDGEYVIAFGEAPPSGDSSFIGSGALVSVSAGETTALEVVDRIRLIEPITVTE